jgi:preprotein translocase SecE subunit
MTDRERLNVANKMSEKKKSSGQSEMEETKAQVSEKELKSARASARQERQSKPASKPVKRDARVSSQASGKKSGGFRNWALVRFVRESYRELRYKVTWPTFVEARNMTLVVILVSTAVGLVLGLVDQGLLQAFKAITGK